MSNLLERAINCDDGDRAAKIIQDALGIELDEVCRPVRLSPLFNRGRSTPQSRHGSPCGLA